MKPEFIEFDRDTMRPFLMYDGEYQYDVEYHRAGDQLYIETSGSGSPCMEWHKNYWWAIPGLHPDISDPKTGDRCPAPLENRIDLPGEYLDEETGGAADVQMWAYYSRLILCEVCEDRVPEDTLCEHLVWDEDEEDYVVKEIYR